MAGDDVSPRFALAALAVWRMTHLLAEEDGPGDVVVRLRRRLGEGSLGGLMDCFYCLSVWVAVPFSFGVVRRRRDVTLAWLGLSGAACLLERVTSWPAGQDRAGLSGPGRSVVPPVTPAVTDR